MDFISRILELAMAGIVLVSISIGIISLWKPFWSFLESRGQADVFLEFLSDVLNIVIGVEFFKMLSQPVASTVLEVLMFVIARHMIVHDTSAGENLLTIIGIAAIFLIKKYLYTSDD